MSNSNAIGVVGVDGVAPIYQPDARWTIWSLRDIYTGENAIGANKNIPKVNDWVVEPETGIIYIVTDLHNVTFIPELSVLTIKQTVSNDELISSTLDNYRLYFDKSVTPYTLTPDGFMRTYSTTASFARIYQGNNIDETKIISRRYDNSGNFIGHNIPLTMVQFNSHDNYGVKSVPACNTTVDLVDGESCIIVIFDSNSKVISKVKCIVDNTTYVSQAYAEQKYVTEIFIKSVFIEDTNTGDINYPVNLPMQSFSPIAVVQYNDGSQIEYPVDGNKFSLFGLDQFTSTIIGHKVPLVLSYRLDPNEAALANVASSESDGYYITRPYNLVVSNPNRSYNVKMFVYPVWVDELNGYKYKVFLMNLDRNILFDITNIVGLTQNSPAFNPLAYGVTQRLTFSVDLAKVSGMYSTYLHVQTVDIVLRGQASDTSLTNVWEVGSQVPSSRPYYGTNLRAVRNESVHSKIYIGNNLDTVQDFINKVYIPTSPLFNPVTELEAPTPTHIEVCYQDKTVFVPISDYDKELLFSSIVPKLTNIDIVFYKETVTGYLKLSVASMLVR